MQWIAKAALAAVLVTPSIALAWSSHALATWQALGVMPEVAARAPVQVESLERFLQAQQHALVRLLEEEEQWARQHIPQYPPRPDALAFAAGGSPEELRQRFLHALRLNPASRLTLFIQARPGSDTRGHPTLPWRQVTTLERDLVTMRKTFLLLREGGTVAPLDVVATASDEPDFGLDLGIWEDNGTEYGKRYGWGRQPFGNPALEFSSQAPMHMGFYHESPIVYRAAPFLQRCFPEVRIRQFRRLSEHAFASGHPYWGWRFAGWALHYIQDLTQPYHSSVLPGVGISRMLWVNTLDLLRYRTPKAHAVSLVSNRHQVLEHYQYSRMREAYRQAKLDDALLAAARDVSLDAGTPAYRDESIREVVTRQAHAAGERTDAVLQRAIPPKYISDPAYVFPDSEPDIDLLAILRANPAAGREQELANLTASLMRNFGTHSRAFVRTVLGTAAAR